MIQHILILALISIGICCTMWEGMIAEPLGDWIESKVGEFWAKPLGKCYICTSFWISAIIVALVGWPWWYPIATMGMCAVISLFQKDE